MTSDPVIDRIRRTRGDISKEYGHDPFRYARHLKALEKRYKGRKIGMKPRPPGKVVAGV